MNATDIAKKLERLEVEAYGMKAFADKMIESVTALKQGINGSDAPKIPTRKGSARNGKKNVLAPEQIAEILTRRERNRNKKSHQ